MRHQLLFICVVQRCTNDHSGNGAEWCATSVTRDGAVIPGEWGDCDFDNIHCRYTAPGSIVLILDCTCFVVVGKINPFYF